MDKELVAEKLYLKVVAEFNTRGEIRPQSFYWEDGRQFEIDRILDIRNCASLKVGGVGTRYTCRVRNKIVKLFLEDNKWFLDK